MVYLKKTFYDEQKKVAILPMGFCYPVQEKAGVTTRPECAATWRAQVLSALPNIQAKLIIGKYASLSFTSKHKGNLTQVVKGLVRQPSALIPYLTPVQRNNKRRLKGNCLGLKREWFYNCKPRP